MSHSNHQEQQQQMVYNQVPRPAASVRMKAAAGEIVEVQGGHIVRSIGRKDRHSKVCTSKGPRDRRVRLSAHTAIQFYDVQDRLGYDRPSKAVDWLIKNAKAAIDELAELPPWHPTATAAVMTSTDASIDHHEMGIVSSDHRMVTVSAVSSPPTAPYNYTGSDLLPPSLASDAIADTIKYFFPMATVAASSSSSNYPADLMSCPNSQTQDLRLSLQSFQHDPILINSQSTTSAPLAFDVAWSHQSPPRGVHWNPSGGGGGGDYFNVEAAVQTASAQQPLHAVPLHQLLVHGTAATQRGPLQSNSPQPFRMWTDPTTAIHHAEASGYAYGNYPGFRIPARIRGEEEHGGMHGKPSSSASSPPRR